MLFHEFPTLLLEYLDIRSAIRWVVFLNDNRLITSTGPPKATKAACLLRKALCLMHGLQSIDHLPSFFTGVKLISDTMCTTCKEGVITKVDEPGAPGRRALCPDCMEFKYPETFTSLGSLADQLHRKFRIYDLHRSFGVYVMSGGPLGHANIVKYRRSDNGTKALEPLALSTVETLNLSDRLGETGNCALSKVHVQAMLRLGIRSLLQPLGTVNLPVELP